MKKIILTTLIIVLIFPFISTTLAFAYDNAITENEGKETQTNQEEKVEKIEEEEKEQTSEETEKAEESVTEDTTNKEEIENQKEIDKRTEETTTQGTGELEEENVMETSLETEGSVIEEGTYYITTAINPNMIFDITDKSSEDGAILQLWGKSSQVTDNQKFETTSLGDGYYTIQAKHSGKVLDVPGESTVNGTKIQQYTSNGTDAQKWIIKDTGDGYYNIISKCNGLYLDVSGANARDGKQMQVYEGNGSTAQKFNLVKVEEVEEVVPKETIEEGTYYIATAINPDMIFDITDKSSEDGAILQLWGKSSQVTDNQKFEITSLGDGYYTIQAKHSGKVLDVPGESTVNGTKIQQYTSNGTDAQKWIIKDTGDGYYNIISKCNGLYLDVSGANARDGKQMQVYEENGSIAQKFNLVKVEEVVPKETIEEGTYYIKSAINSDMVFDIAGLSTENGAILQLWGKSSQATDNQKFEITSLGDGYYTIQAKHSGKVLDVPGASTTNGTKIQQYTSNGTDAQKWIIKDTGDGYYNIISKCNGLYLDIPGANASDGKQVQIYEGNGSTAQKFAFEKVEETANEKRLEDGIYKISTALNSNMYLDISQGSYSNQANLQIWGGNAVQQQKFQLTYIEDGYYEIKSVNSGKVLDVAGGSNKNGANVQQYEANQTEYQKWILKDAGNGYYHIMSKGAEAYLDVAGGVGIDGANVQIYEGNQTNSQKFKFEKTQIIDNNQYEIETALDSNMVLDVDIPSSNLQIWECNHASSNQKFKLESIGSGYYKIICSQSGQTLTVEGTNVKQAVYTDSDNQKWKVEIAGNGYYFIQSKSTGMYLDIFGGLTTNGNNAQIYQKNETTSQMFKFIIYESKSNFSSLDETKYPGYKALLEQLQAQHPNWIITIKYTGLDWDTVLNNEDQLVNGIPKSLTQNINEWRNGNAEYGSGWYRASKSAIAYMMDPRNSLEEAWIFQFQDLESSAGTYSDIAKMTQGTFLNTDNMINTILSISQSNGISPFHLTSRMIQEQGKNGWCINGYTYNGRTVYNYCNIGATGSNDQEIVANGAAYAYNHHWFTPETCIMGSADFLKQEYISKGQSTLYFQKYNVVDHSNLYNHQYMQNIRAANDEGNTIYDSYKANGLLDSEFEFTIPVYENMPSSACPRPKN